MDASSNYPDWQGLDAAFEDAVPSGRRQSHKSAHGTGKKRPVSIQRAMVEPRMSPAEALREAMETATSKLPAGRGAAKKVLRPKKNAAAVKRSPKEHGGAAGIANETEETRHGRERQRERIAQLHPRHALPNHAGF